MLAGGCSTSSGALGAAAPDFVFLLVGAIAIRQQNIAIAKESHNRKTTQQHREVIE
jgi:hypothetical protein